MIRTRTGRTKAGGAPLARNLGGGVLGRLFPCICVLCGQRSARDVDLCRECEEALDVNAGACPRCAAPFAAPRDAAASEYAGAQEDAGVCGTCLASPPPWRRTVAPFAYSAPLSRIVTGLKSGNGLLEARVLGALLLPFVRQRYADEALPEALLPVPMTWRRRRQRGYNQAELLGRELGRALDRPQLRNRLVRVKHAPPQRSLPRAARLRNLRGAFKVKGPLGARRVALVDDVTTTGATVRAAASALLAAGASEVDVWTVAKTAAK